MYSERNTSSPTPELMDIILPSAFYTGEWKGRLPLQGPQQIPARRKTFFESGLAPVVLISPKLNRWVIGQRLARVGGWPVVVVKSNQVHLATQALEELAGTGTGIVPAAVVVEGWHGDKITPMSAEQLYDWLNRPSQIGPKLGWAGVPWLLYTDDLFALSEARTAYEFARRTQRPTMNRFVASMQHNKAADSDLALIQLLEHLIKPKSVTTY